ncbi:hypothetical protein BH10PAT3_BH10PAT3_7130 [soil metagenome]
MNQPNELIPIQHNEYVFLDASVAWLVRPLPVFEREAKKNNETWQLKINSAYLRVRDELYRRRGHTELQTGYGCITAELSEFNTVILEVSHGTLPGKKARYFFDDMSGPEQTEPDVQSKIVYFDGEKIFTSLRDEKGRVSSTRVNLDYPQLVIIHQAIRLLDTLLGYGEAMAIQSVGEIALDGI